MTGERAGRTASPSISRWEIDAAGDRRAGHGHSMFFKSLAYPSTLDRPVGRPTWRSFGARRSRKRRENRRLKQRRLSAALSYVRSAGGPFSLRRNLEFDQRLFKLSITL